MAGPIHPDDPDWGMSVGLGKRPTPVCFSGTGKSNKTVRRR